jgi:hypothetical protein
MVRGLWAAMSERDLNSLTIERLLQLEDDPALLQPVCKVTGIPFWVLLRTPFFRTILYDTLYDKAPSNSYHAIPYFRAVLVLAKSLWYNWKHRHIRECDVLIISSGMGCILKNGRWFNRLGDHFAMQRADRTTLIEEPFAWRWPFPRINDRTLLGLPTAVIGQLVGRLGARKHRATAVSLVESSARRAQKLLGWKLSEKDREELISHLSRKIASLPWLYRHWTRFLQQAKPSVILKEEGCYGPSAALICAARKLGIATAEYQHGAVSGGHDAYNVAAALIDSPDYRATLPNYFLGYGRWWNNEINIPVKTLPVGNPHRSEILEKMGPRNSDGVCQILILGDGVDEDSLFAWSEQLARELGEGFRVVFRPHPSNLANFLSKRRDRTLELLVVDDTPDLYGSLVKVDVVVSELSTGLFEAIGIVQRIFMWTTPKSDFAFPNTPFEKFSSLDDLVNRLKAPPAQVPEMLASEQFWEPFWRTNYANFLNLVGVKPMRSSDDKDS